MSNAKLQEAMEDAFFLMSEVEGLLQEVKINNLKGYLVPSIDFEEINFVGKSNLTSEQVENTIQEVKDFFAQHKLTRIGWIIGPTSKPENLVKILKQNGFEHNIDVWGMYRPMIEPLDITLNEKFEFRELTLKEITPEIHEMGDKAYGSPKGSSAMFFKMFQSVADKFKFHLFYAFHKNKPVGFGNIVEIGSNGYLGGAGVLPEYRNQGIYSGMLKIRYDLAKKAGYDNLIINAKELTSAPIAQKNGFRKLINIPFYLWLNETPNNLIIHE